MLNLNPAWLALMSKCREAQGVMAPADYRETLIGVFGAIIANIPEDYWDRMLEVQACGSPDCNCQELSVNAMRAFEQWRTDYSKLMEEIK